MTLKDFEAADLAFVFSLPPLLEQVFRMLMAQPRVPSEVIAERLNVTTPKTAILRLRRALQKHGIEVQSKRHLGYWIEPADKKRLVELAQSYIKEANPTE